jgi:hypothetical protein
MNLLLMWSLHSVMLKKVSITANEGLWRFLDPVYVSLESEAEQLLQRGELINALLFCIQQLGEILNEPK